MKTILELAESITIPSVNLKQVTTPKMRYYEDERGNRYPSATTVLQHFHDNDLRYVQALSSYEQLLRNFGISPERRLQYTSARGTMGHYLLTSLLSRKTNQKLPEFEIEHKQIRQYLKKVDGFNQSRWPLFTDLSNIIFMIGKFLYEHEVIPVNNGVEFRVLSKKYEYAGTCDLFCYIDRRLSILDIKTAWIKKDGQSKISSQRMAKFEAQVSAYKQAMLEMMDYTIEPQQCLILSLCPDEYYPMNSRMLNPDLNYYLYECQDRLDEFLECRETFKTKNGF